MPSEVTGKISIKVDAERIPEEQEKEIYKPLSLILLTKMIK
jgi:hypothetical protein